MDCIQINQLLNREEQEIKIKNILSEFETNKHNVLFKKGIYIYGSPGTGKTMFVTNILRELNYDIVKYDAGDIRNTSVIEDITKHNMSDKNIMSIFNRKIKKIAIIMDEIDGMNNGDKGGINSERLIELLKNNILKNKKGYLLLMDNARAHKSDVVKEYIKESGNYVLYTVPYQHYLNPVEEYFNQLKHYIKVEKPMTKEALKKSVSKSLPKIKKKNYKNYYNHVFDKSKLKKKETKKSTLYRKSKVYKNKS